MPAETPVNEEHPHVHSFEEPWVPQWIKDYRWSPPTKELIANLRKYVLATNTHIETRAEWDGQFVELPIVAEWDKEHPKP